MMHRFYWLVDGVLAGCSRPGGDPRRSPSVQELNDDLLTLRERGIGAVLSMTETSLDEAVLEHHGLDALHVPVPDMTAPHPAQLMESLAFIDRSRAAGRAVAVHCLQGQGRTGTVLGAYLIRDGMKPDEAITYLRFVCPGAVENEEQMAALRAFAARRDWIL